MAVTILLTILALFYLEGSPVKLICYFTGGITLFVFQAQEGFNIYLAGF